MYKMFLKARLAAALAFVLLVLVLLAPSCSKSKPVQIDGVFGSNVHKYEDTGYHTFAATVELEQNGTFSFCPNVFGSSGGCSGTYKVKGDVVTMTGSDQKGREYSLTFTVKDGDTLIFRPSESSNLEDMSFNYPYDFELTRRSSDGSDG